MKGMRSSAFTLAPRSFGASPETNCMNDICRGVSARSWYTASSFTHCSGCIRRNPMAERINTAARPLGPGLRFVGPNHRVARTRKLSSRPSAGHLYAVPLPDTWPRRAQGGTRTSAHTSNPVDVERIAQGGWGKIYVADTTNTQTLLEIPTIRQAANIFTDLGSPSKAVAGTDPKHECSHALKSIGGLRPPRTRWLQPSDRRRV